MKNHFDPNQPRDRTGKWTSQLGRIRSDGDVSTADLIRTSDFIKAVKSGEHVKARSIFSSMSKSHRLKVRKMAPGVTPYLREHERQYSAGDTIGRLKRSEIKRGAQVNSPEGDGRIVSIRGRDIRVRTDDRAEYIFKASELRPYGEGASMIPRVFDPAKLGRRRLTRPKKSRR